ncbi:MAG: D-alanyl-D-alanine carboxypeptidase, partial [Clostridia bacterium]|nr:D-alanyl-D-alanine carboxypeptidase [Clostridia bacterium]
MCSIHAEEIAIDVSAPSALLMDYSTGKILYEKNIHDQRPLASVTKIMTMLLAMEEISCGNLSYDDTIIGTSHAKSYGGSTIFLDEGEQMSVRDILKGIAVASGNDAAVALGEHISGSEEAFVQRMNQKAKELGMENTNFVNCNGLDADGHYSCAYDIALMSRELMKYDDIFEFTTIWMDSLRNGQFMLSNTNKLVRFYDGCTGLKTGSTSKAGFCIS